MNIKNLLLSLFGGLIILLGLSSFCSATDYSFYSFQTNYVQAGETMDFPWYGNNCLLFKSSSCLNNAQLLDSNGNLITGMGISQMLCFNGTGRYINNYTSRCTVDIWSISVPTCPTCPTCPSQYTSEECQSEYGLVSSGVLNSCLSSLSGCQLDLNSCQSSLSGWNNTLDNCSNNLLSCQSSLSSCIAGNCPLDNGDNVQWSSLFINNIQHIGAPLININIPEEISWDYTSSTGSFDLDVEGYNVDSDYIEGVINIQNSKPTKEDFNNIITGLIPLFVPGLVIILFIYFVFYLIKKIFK